MLKSHQKSIFEALGRNPIHPFPARMAPGIALDALGDGKRTLRVLDPMAGSGTVLAVARAKGHRAIGVDLDPLAVLMATVWTRTIDRDEVRDWAQHVLSRAKAQFSNLSTGAAYPNRCDEETRRFIRYWFDEYARRQLAALSMAIDSVESDEIRDALWCGFSRLIIAKSAGASLAMDLSHSRPHREFNRAPVKPFGRFIAAVETVVTNCPRRGSESLGPPAIVKQGDARHLDIRDASIDLVLSSPPYLNAIDYMRCSKFSLVWMGHTIEELRSIRGESVGSEIGYTEALEFSWVRELLGQLRLRPALSKRSEAILARYAVDLSAALAEVSRVLRRDGRAVFVIGESTSRSTFIRNSRILTFVAEAHGLLIVSRQSRTLPANRRYLPPPRLKAAEKMDGRLRREVVVALRKP